MVLKDAMSTRVCVFSALVRVVVHAAHEEPLLVGLHEDLPEVIAFVHLNQGSAPQIMRVRDASCEVHEAFRDVAIADSFIVAVQLGVCLLHEWQPELGGVGALREE